MIPLTPELEKQILAKGGIIYEVTLEEFQKIMSEGEVLSNEEVQKHFNIYNKK
jgi:hypothetical protein